jgi:4'-phosphopantetheinyl transferase
MGLDLSDSTQVIWLPLDLPARELEEKARWLAPGESERAARFRFSRDRDRYVATWTGVRAVLGKVLNRDPASIQFGYGPFGKPALEPEDLARQVQFSVSHSQGMGLLALQAEDEVGVDIEAVRSVPDALAIAQRLFTAEESRVLEALPPGERDLVFARYWTGKEALLKSIGRGLSHPVNTFAVPPGELTEPLLIELGDAGARQSRWLLPMPPSLPGYVAAIATAGGPRPVRRIAPPPP